MFKKLVKKTLGMKSPLDIYSYSIDVVSDKEIVGWAFKKDDAAHVVKIDVISNHVPLWSAEAR